VAKGNSLLPRSHPTYIASGNIAKRGDLDQTTLKGAIGITLVGQNLILF